MPVNNGSDFMDMLQAQFTGNDTAGGSPIVQCMAEKQYRFDRLGADPNAATVNTLHNIGMTRQQLVAIGFSILPDAALTSDDTNNATIVLGYNNGNGGSTTNIVTINTATTGSGGTGSWTANTAIAATVSSTYFPSPVVPSGSMLQLRIVKNGTGGVQVNACSLEWTFKPV